MKRFTLEQVRSITYKGGKGEYVAEISADLTGYISQNRTPTGEPVRNSYRSRVNGKPVGAGSLVDCKIAIGLHLLGLEQ